MNKQKHVCAMEDMKQQKVMQHHQCQRAYVLVCVHACVHVCVHCLKEGGLGLFVTVIVEQEVMN
jgi:hypothetical protein